MSVLNNELGALERSIPKHSDCDSSDSQSQFFPKSIAVHTANGVYSPTYFQEIMLLKSLSAMF